MNCKKCQAELAEGVTLCPACGSENAAEEFVIMDAPAIEVESPVEIPAEKPEAPEKPKLSTGKITLLVGLAVVAIAVVIALIVGGMGGNTPSETTDPTGNAVAGTIPPDGNPDDATCKGSYSVSDEIVISEADTVVATMGDAKLTIGELQVYYWMQVSDFLGQYGSYASMFGLDYTQPLDTQLSLEGTLTWQQYFLDSAVDTWRNYQAMCLAAEEDGYVLDAEYADYLEDMPDYLTETAAESGFESVDAMVRDSFSAGADVQSYLSFMEHYYLGYMYYSDTMEAMEVTDAEIETYFDSHSDEYKENGLEKGDDKYVDVRHILLQPTGGTKNEDGTTTYSEAEWAAAEAAANEVLNTWLSGEKTEESFAELAGKHSTDGGSSSNGGLYTNVKVGDMVEPFENWCFDASRKTGDYGIVKTTYGYHVMYYVEGRLIWQTTAKDDLMVEKGNEFLQSVLKKYPAEVNYGAMVLGNVELGAAQ